MSHAAPGRHRAAPAKRETPAAVMIGSVVLVGVLIAGALTWWLAVRSPGSDGPSTATTPDAFSSATPRGAASTVESERVVTVDGNVVTIEETSAVSAGGATKVMPSRATSTGLSLIGASVVTAQGLSQSLDAPIELTPAGSLTVRARYRLTDCPDLLPPQWPSPTEFPNAIRTYTRINEPLHTAYALCPDKRSRAKPLDNLSGSVDAGLPVTVRLEWTGSSPLTIDTVGSASGVAVVVVEPGCGGSCAAQVSPGETAMLSVQPIDPCPPANTNDVVTLKRADGDVIALTVKGLHRAICR
ncbi:MAG TPA: hypothetical protein VFX15_12510 [Actinomycetes bacterium]|nr:hypothetical protein [Actinomycetes bacterium]